MKKSSPKYEESDDKNELSFGFRPPPPWAGCGCGCGWPMHSKQKMKSFSFIFGQSVNYLKSTSIWVPRAGITATTKQHIRQTSSWTTSVTSVRSTAVSKRIQNIRKSTTLKTMRKNDQSLEFDIISLKVIEIVVPELPPKPPPPPPPPRLPNVLNISDNPPPWK